MKKISTRLLSFLCAFILIFSNSIDILKVDAATTISIPMYLYDDAGYTTGERPGDGVQWWLKDGMSNTIGQVTSVNGVINLDLDGRYYTLTLVDTNRYTASPDYIVIDTTQPNTYTSIKVFESNPPPEPTTTTEEPSTTTEEPTTTTQAPRPVRSASIRYTLNGDYSAAAGVEVKVFKLDGTLFGTYVTDQNGYINVPGLVEGENYTFKVPETDPSMVASPLYKPINDYNITISSYDVWNIIKLESRVVRANITVKKPYTDPVTGVVSEVPAPGVPYIYNGTTYTTDANGKLTIDLPPNDNVNIYYGDKDHYIYDNRAYGDSNMVSTWGSGSPIREITWRVDPIIKRPFQLVVRDTNGAPVPNVSFSFSSPQDWNNYTITTDANGVAQVLDNGVPVSFYPGEIQFTPTDNIKYEYDPDPDPNPNLSDPLRYTITKPDSVADENIPQIFNVVVTENTLYPVKINVLNITTNQPAPNVTYEIYKEGNSLGLFTSDANGQINQNFPPGSYSLRAIEDNPNLVFVDRDAEFYLSPTNNPNLTLKVEGGTPTSATFPATIVSVDKYSYQPLTGYTGTYTVTPSDGSDPFVLQIDPATGSAKFEAKNGVTYTVEQSNFPGYTAEIYPDMFGPIPIFDQNNPNIRIQNTGDPKPFTITKLDQDTNQPIAGVTFAVYTYFDVPRNQFSAPYQIWYKSRRYTRIFDTLPTDANGKTTFNYQGDPSGYLFIETSVPAPYVLSTKLNADFTTDSATIYNKKIDPNNVPVITKVDASTKAPLPGAKFKLAIEDDDSFNFEIDGHTFRTLDEEFISGSDGVIPFVFPDLTKNYAYYESEVPAGYQADTNEYQPKILDLTKGNQTIENTPEGYSNFTLTKIEWTREYRGSLEWGNFKYLPGAEFDVLDSSGNKVGSLVTGADGVAQSPYLKNGQYTLVETKAPTGYKINPTPIRLYLPNSSDTVAVANLKEDSKVTINKKDSINGAMLPGATFRIYRTSKVLSGNENFAGTQPDGNANPQEEFINYNNKVYTLMRDNPTDSGEYITDANGQINMELPLVGFEGNFVVQYDYVVVETKAPDGYIIDNKNVVPIDLTNGDTSLEFTNTPTFIRVKKTWVGETPTSVRPASLSFTLTGSDGSTVTRNFTPSTDVNVKNETFDIDGIPFTDTNGNPITYTLTEGPVAGYTSTINGFEVTNTLVPEMITVPVTKTWVGGPDAKPPVTINLMNGTTPVKTMQLASGQLNGTFTDVPKYDASGNVINYTVKEDPVTNYTATYNGTNVTNTYVPEKTDVTVTKTWVNGPTTKPTITLRLLNGDTEVANTTLTSGTTTYTFTGVPKTDNAGNLITYTVKEDSVDNYTTTYNGLNVTNTFVPKLISITVNKAWVGGPTDKPAITVNLKNGDVTVKSIQITNGNTTGIFTDVPETDANGNVINYTISEEAVENYTTAIDGFNITNTYVSEPTDITVNKTWVGGPTVKPTITVHLMNGTDEVATGTIANGTTSYVFRNVPKKDDAGNIINYTVKEEAVPNFVTSYDGLNITNTYVPETTDVTVTKTWVNGPTVKPDVTLKLFNGTNEVASKLLSSGTLSHTFTDLPKTDSNGNLITYTVKEDAVDNYTATYDGLKVTNTYTPTLIDIPVTKTWVGGPDVKPTITVRLMNEQGEVKSAQLTNGTTNYVFTGVPKTDLNGNTITYKVTEDDVPSYTKSVNGYNITNTYVVDPTSITVTKKWVGGATPRPVVTVNLMNGTQLVSTGEILDGQTSYTFNNIPRTDANGNAINYTVKEEALENYTSAVNGLEITNTYVPEVGQIEVTKTWVNGPDVKPTITVRLMNGTQEVANASILPTESSHIFENIPLYDSNGVKINYTVKEDPVANYATTYDGLNITNTYVKEKIDLTVNKFWVGGPDVKPTITFRLMDGLREVKFGQISNGQSSYTFANIDKTDDNGNIIDYHIEEDELTSYSTLVDKFNVTNTYVVDAINITANKTWVGGPQLKPNVTLYLYNGDTLVQTGTILSGETSFIFKNVPRVDSNGNVITYTIKEDPVANYKTTISGYNVTNTYVPEKMDITGKKIWKNGPDEKPEITINLLKGTEVIDSKVLTNGETDYTFKDVQKTDNDGNLITYTISENPVAGYESSVAGYDVLNKYIQEKKDIEVKKTWVGGPTTRPDITVRLYSGTDELKSAVIRSGETSYVFKDMPVNDLNGNPINYIISEDPVPNYTTLINGFEIKNTFVQDPTNIVVKKTWVGGPLEKPVINLKLMNGTDEVATGVLTSDKTEYTFSNVPRTDSNGNVINYTVLEDQVDGYVSNINGFNITNTYVPKVKDIKVKKTWVNGPSVKPTITVHLMNGTVEIAKGEILNGSTSYVFKDIPVTDNEGNIINYTVTEDPVEHYKTDIEGFKITNAYEPEKIEIKVEKVWVRGTNVKPTITIRLWKNDGEKVTYGQIKNGETQLIFANLNKTDENGNVIKYYITEDDTNEYTSKIEGFKVTNEYNLPDPPEPTTTTVEPTTTTVEPTTTTVEPTTTTVEATTTTKEEKPNPPKNDSLPNTGSENSNYLLFIGLAMIFIGLGTKRNRKANIK